MTSRARRAGNTTCRHDEIKQLTNDVENGIGFCYWGGELISWKGNQSIDASSWENQALFDFESKALPVLREFKTE